MIPDRIAEIGRLLRTQDNRITDAPLFIVQEQKRTYGFDPQWANDSEIAWLDGCNDSVEALDKRLRDLRTEMEAERIEMEAALDALSAA